MTASESLQFEEMLARRLSQVISALRALSEHCEKQRETITSLEKRIEALEQSTGGGEEEK